MKRNLYLTSEDHIKIGNLGYSRSNESEKMVSTFVGATPYISPEIRNNNYTYTTDIW